MTEQEPQQGPEEDLQVRFDALRLLFGSTLTRTMYRRQNPQFEKGLSLGVVAFVLGVISAAALLDLYRGSPKAWHPAVILLFTLASAGVGAIAIGHLQRYGRQVQAVLAVILFGFPALAFAVTLVRMIRRVIGL